MKEVKVKEVETVKVNVPKFGEILTKRPKGMSYSEYRHRLSMQNAKLKAKLKARRQFGFLCYKAVEIIDVGAGEQKNQQRRIYAPCVGKKFILNYV